MVDGNDSLEESIQPPQEDDDVSGLSWFQAIRRITSNRNWTIFTSTVWIYSSMFVFHSYFTLYFRDIGISYIFTGVILSLMYVIIFIGSVFSGYIIDNYDRRNLPVIGFIPGIFFYLILALSTDAFFVALAFMITGLGEFTSGSGNA